MFELLLNRTLFVIAGRCPAFRDWLEYHFVMPCIRQTHHVVTEFGRELWFEDTNVPGDRLSTVKRCAPPVLIVILYRRSTH